MPAPTGQPKAGRVRVHAALGILARRLAHALRGDSLNVEHTSAWTVVGNKRDCEAREEKKQRPRHHRERARHKTEPRRERTHRGPGQAHDDARGRRLVQPLALEDGLADVVRQRVLCDDNGAVVALALARDQLQRALAEDLVNLLLQVADTALTAVVADENAQRLFVNLKLREPRL